MPDGCEPGPDESLDRLSRTLRILQARRGHRAASDDVWLAWAASRAAPQARRILDLGTGKGTVALLLLARLPRAKAVGVEAVPAAWALAVRNARLNGLADRFDPRLGDLREAGLLAGEAPFDLVTGAPPFLPVGTGVLPREAHRAAGRFELRGGVEAYAGAAAARLAPGGRVVLLMDGAGGARAEAAVGAAGLSVRGVLTVHPRPGRPPTYTVVEAGAGAGPARAVESVTMREGEGEAWSAAYAAVRADLDLP